MNQFESTKIARDYQRRIKPIDYGNILRNVCLVLFVSIMLVSFVYAVIDSCLQLF